MERHKVLIQEEEKISVLGRYIMALSLKTYQMQLWVVTRATNSVSLGKTYCVK